MFRVRIYATDKTAKSGRKQINSKTAAGASVEQAAKLVSDTLAALPAERREKISRVVIESEGSDSVSDLGISFGEDKPAEATEDKPNEAPAEGTPPAAAPEVPKAPEEKQRRPR